MQRLGKISIEDHASITPGTSKQVCISAVGQLSERLTWTDATMNVGGTLIAVLSYEKIVFFPRAPSQTVANALQSAACTFMPRTDVSPEERQFEAITFMPFPYYAVTSECLNKAPSAFNIYSYELVF